MSWKRITRTVAAALLVAAALSAGRADAGRCRATDLSSLAEEIAFGHAYDKHVVREGQFRTGHVVGARAFPGPSIESRSDFAAFLEGILRGFSAAQRLESRRYAYWDTDTGTVVIVNLRADDCGTAFRPRGGRGYYEGLR